MADSLNQKSPKTGDKPKPCNVVHRTTSETIRLGEPERNVNPPPTSLTSGTPSIKKKTPSFQITSVTVNSRMSNDGGDDSADDLDESHTEDNSDVIDSSKITDIENETPSFSEDTFSKDDIFFNPSAASLGTAPVIPTSSQYGLAIVSEGAGGAGVTGGVAGANTIGSGVTCSDLHVSVSDNVININTKSEERDTVTNRNERFKVVKIESTEPFKRGRWVCMDFLDHSNTSSNIAKEAVGKEDSLVCGVSTAVGESAVEPTIVVGDLGIVGGVDFGGVKSTLPDHRNPPGGPGPPPSGLPPHLSGFPQVPPHQSMPGMGPMHASTQQYYQPAQSVGVAGFEQTAGATAASVQTLPSIHHPQQSQQVPQTQPGVVSTTQGQSIVGMVQQQPQIPNGTTTSGVTVGSTVSTQTSMGTGHGVLPTQQQSMVQGMPQQQQVHPQPMTSQASGYVPAPQQNMAQHAQQQQGNIGPFIHMQQPPPQQPSAIPQVGQQQGMTQAQTQQHQHPQHQQHQQPQLQQPQHQHQQHPPQAQGGYITVQQQQNQQNLVQQQPQSGINQQHQPHPGYVTGQSVPQQAMGQPTGFVQTTGQSLQGQTGYITQVTQPTQQQSQPPVQGFMPQQQQQQQPQQQAMQPPQHPQTQQQPAAYIGVPSQGQPSPQQQQTAAFMAQQQVSQGQSQANAQVMTTAGQSQPAPQPQMTYMAPQQKSQAASMPHQPAYIQQPTQGPPVGFVNPQTQVSQQQGQSYQHSLSHHPQQEQGIMNEDPSLVGVDHHVEAMVNAPTNGGVVATDDGVPVAVSQVASVVVQPSSAQGGAEDAESFMGLARALASSSSSASSSSASTAVPTPAPLPLPPATSSPSAPMIPAVATAISNNPPPPGPPPTPAQPPQQPPATAARSSSPLPAFTETDKFISASGTSAVAIDNKIEQAMDLVKSHLMFAVREEVEVLKEKIAELMERINQLEVENSILKAHASTETLAQLGGGGAGGGGGQAVLPPTASMQMQAQGQQQAS